jgi:hypothetical protein
MNRLTELTKELIDNHVYARIPLLADVIGVEGILDETENPSEEETSSFYLVSEWLGKRLIEEGEEVNQQYDLPIWCRKSGGIQLEDEFIFQQIAKVQANEGAGYNSLAPNK